MITPGKPGKPGKPDGPHIRLQQEEASMSLVIVQPGKTSGWKIIDTSKPRKEWDLPNRGTRTVAFEAIAPASGRLRLIVLFTPGSRQPALDGTLTLGQVKNALVRTLDIRPLEDWGS